MLVQGEVTAAAAGDLDAAAVAHDAAERFLAMLSDSEESTTAARAAHHAVGTLLRAMKRR